jgi:hypothetical protein
MTVQRSRYGCMLAQIQANGGECHAVPRPLTQLADTRNGRCLGCSRGGLGVLVLSARAVNYLAKLAQLKPRVFDLGAQLIHFGIECSAQDHPRSVPCRAAEAHIAGRQPL